jgi:cysteine dioxygenase
LEPSSSSADPSPPPPAWTRYAHFDPDRHYTRNLVATDGETYTVLLLCWNAGTDRYSPIHDHPCDGCWMKVLEGSVHECRYDRKEAPPQASLLGGDNASDQLVLTQETMAHRDDVVFISDHLGLHRVGNPSETVPAVTLHVYAPPFATCKIWCNSTTTTTNNCGDKSSSSVSSNGVGAITATMATPSSSKICHYSEYGKKVL